MQMLVISIVGFLISNQDFTLQDAHLQYLVYYIHLSFLTFMKVILQRFTPEMLQNNYWARSLKEIVALKSKKPTTLASSGGQDQPQTDSLAQQNKKLCDNLSRMLKKCE